MPILQAPGRVFSQYRALVPLFPQLSTFPCCLHLSFSHLLFFKVICCGCWHPCGLATAFPAAAILGIPAAPWMFIGTSSISTQKKTSFWDVVQISFQNGHGETQSAGLCQGEKKSLPSPTHHANKQLSLEGECTIVLGTSTRTKNCTYVFKEAVIGLWRRVCLHKRKRKPLTKLGLVRESNPAGGPGTSTQTLRSRLDLWDVQQKTSHVRRYGNFQVMAVLPMWMVLGDWKKWRKKKENTLASRTAEFANLLEVSTCFYSFFQIHFRGMSSCTSPQSPFSTAGFCLSLVTANGPQIIQNT